MAGEIGSGTRFAALKQQLAREDSKGAAGGAKKGKKKHAKKKHAKKEMCNGREMGSNSRMMDPTEEEAEGGLKFGSNSRMMGMDDEEKER